MKTKKALLALTLALALCLSLATLAFADSGPITGDEANPVKVAFTKLLQLPAGTTVPTAKFEFLVTSKTVDGDAATKTNMPLIGTDVQQAGVIAGIVPINYQAGDSAGIDPDADDVVTVPKEYDIFNGITWPHAGEYVYTISEKPGTYTIADAALETMTYSLAEYTLNVYVRENKTTGKYYIYAIGAIIDTPDNEDQTVDAKVDPTPDGGENEFEYSQMTFTNTYVRTIGGGGEPTDPADASLAIGAQVAGNFSSTSIYFDYTLKLTVPSLPSIPGPTAYKAYVVQDGKIVTTEANGAPEGKDYIEFVSGTPNTFKLKDGQQLVFTNTPVGTRYDIKQEGTTAYKASVIVTYNGVAKPAVSGADFGDPVEVKNMLVGETDTNAAFTNARNDNVTPTGLDIGNLPFFGMIFLALGAVAALVAAKTRKKSYNCN